MKQMTVMHAKTRERRRESGLLDGVPRCSKCDRPNDRAPQRYCRACNTAYQKEWGRGRVKVPRESLTREQRMRKPFHGKQVVLGKTS
jgi:hypothetical protein